MKEESTQHNAEEVTVTLAELKEAGVIDSVNGVQETLKRAVKTAKDAETIERIGEALVEATKNMSEAAQALKAAKEAKRDEERYEQLSSEALVEQFKGLPVNDPKRAEIYNALSREYGEQMTGLALNGNEFTKALHRPITKANPHFEEINDVRDTFDLAWLYTATKGKILPGEESEDIEINMKSFMHSLDRLEKEGAPGCATIRKAMNEAMDTQTATEGFEWVPTGMSANMVEAVYLQLKLASLFPRMTMPTKSYDIPAKTARGRGYRMPEGTAHTQLLTNLATPHTMETGKITFTAEKLASLQIVSDELEQDAILEILRMIREDCIWGLAYSIDDAVLNGSSLTNDLDNAGSDASRLWANSADAGDGIRLATSAIDTRGAWDGLRKLTPTAAKVDFGNAVPTLALLRSLRKPMGKYAVSPEDLALVAGVRTHIDLMNIAEVLTLEKYGPNATVLQGEIGRIDNIPIVLSELVYPYLNASGVFNTNTPGTSPSNRSIVQLVNRRGFAFGDRRMIRIEADRMPLSGMRYVLATWRGDFQRVYPSTEPVTATGYNVAI